MITASVAGRFPAFDFMPDSSWPAESAVPASLGTEGESCDQESVRLMLRVKEGDVKAFERLVELHQNVVIGTVTRMLGDVHDAHDISQQVFLRVWKSAPRYEPSAKFTTWMFTILRNLVFNEMRRRGRKKEVALEAESDEESPRQYADHAAPAPDHLAQQEELERALDKAIAALPEKQRLAVVLRRYDEMAYEDICEVLKMSLPAVKSLLFRARAELRKHLSAYLGESEG